MGLCALCQRRSPLIAEALGLCLGCIRSRPEEARAAARAVHHEVRGRFGQPPDPPRDEGAALCPLCARGCRPAQGAPGYCGLRRGGEGGTLEQLAGLRDRGLLEWYRDPLPTNCVADFVCEGHHQPGRHNLAVFYGACTLDCLFCQNWSFRRLDHQKAPTVSATELAAAATEETFCVCYFGGDPSAQLPHALAASRRLAARGVAVCLETNGLGHPRLMQTAAGLVEASGGTIKVDLKAFDPTLHEVLTSAGNQRVLDNFRDLGRRLGPKLCAATLLVPGYIDVQEVEQIAAYIAEVDPRIPYSLLAFGPEFMMTDLPATSWAHAEAAQRAALDAGLQQVRVANLHLLSRSYDLEERW